MDALHEMAVAAGLTLSRTEAHARFRGGRMADIASWIGAQVRDKPGDFEVEFTRQYRASSHSVSGRVSRKSPERSLC